MMIGNGMGCASAFPVGDGCSAALSLGCAPSSTGLLHNGLSAVLKSLVDVAGYQSPVTEIA